LSFLFDKELSFRQPVERLKTCFVDSFDFYEFDASVIRGVTRNGEAPSLDIPLKEFINYVNTDNMIYYHGSETVPPCSETVTWIVNLSPHVIT
jgi:carbonic anhydrase